MTNTTGTSLFLKGRVYDALKWLALVFLPAFAAFYYGLSDIWNLPNSEQVVGTVVMTETFLGLLVAGSHHNYQKSGQWADGEFEVKHEDGVPYAMGAQLYNVENPMDIANQKKVVFQVKHVDEEFKG